MIKFVLFILYAAGLLLLFLEQMFRPAQLRDPAISVFKSYQGRCRSAIKPGSLELWTSGLERLCSRFLIACLRPPNCICYSLFYALRYIITFYLVWLLPHSKYWHYFKYYLGNSSVTHPCGKRNVGKGFLHLLVFLIWAPLVTVSEHLLVMHCRGSICSLVSLTWLQLEMCVCKGGVNKVRALKAKGKLSLITGATLIHARLLCLLC